MKKLLLYGFIFSVLMNLFQLMYATKKFDYDNQSLEKYKKKVKDTLAIVVAEKEAGDYFSLLHNDKAYDYFEGVDVPKMMQQATEQIKELNSNPKGNPLVTYDRMIINKVRFLNHRWIIADFSGDSSWGEVILEYFVEKNGSITLQPKQTVLYPNN